MFPDDDADDDSAVGGPPLPPEDRLWRHPSEMIPAFAGRAPTPLLAESGTRARGAAWTLVLASAVLGAVVCAGALAATGNLSDAGSQRVVERVAITPVVSSPTLRGPSGVDALARAIAPAVARLVVRSPDGDREATGILVRDDGLLFTSAHEVAGAAAIIVVLADGRRFDGTVVGIDPPTDVAVVSIDADDLGVAVLGTSGSVEVGATAIAVGAPRSGSSAPSVSTGVISGVERRVDGGSETMYGMIQTDAPIEEGWSGGPLLDESGAVIGITVHLAGHDDWFGYATPIDLVRQIADQLLRSGHAAHPWLGIDGADTTEGPTQGVVVHDVAPASPAALAGLAAGDVITTFDHKPVESSSALVVAVRLHGPGDVVLVTYWRGGRAYSTQVVIGDRP